jgi:drug/metabolite transporter (DMT)-like permease
MKTRDRVFILEFMLKNMKISVVSWPVSGNFTLKFLFRLKNIIIGLLFAMLWASASVATKVGVKDAHPLILANVRFFIAGFVLLGGSYLFGEKQSKRLPTHNEFKKLLVFGFLNTTLYLGLYVYAMKFTAAGIGSLAVSTNPLIIMLLSAYWLGRKPAKLEILAIFLGMIGIGCATYPLLENNQSTLFGVGILLTSMVAVSMASVYYSSVVWKLSNTLINGWQVMLGGFMLLPFTLYLANFNEIVWSSQLIGSILWLALAVSVVGLMCWFYLLRIDAVSASLWLFLCPLFGFMYAWWIFSEPITTYTVLGTLLVLIGLYVGQKAKWVTNKRHE